MTKELHVAAAGSLLDSTLEEHDTDLPAVSYPHVRNIYSKLQVHNLSGAVAKAMQLGLI